MADSDEETEVETETEAGATGKAEGEEDYEVLDFQRKAGIADEECCQANSQVNPVLSRSEFGFDEQLEVI